MATPAIAETSKKQPQAMLRVPIGVALPWFPHLSPILPSNFVECDGQTLDDASSPLNGKVIPNLNSGSYLLGGAMADSGARVGSNSFSLSAAHLPAVEFSGSVGAASAGTPSGTVTTAAGGAHTHTVTDPGHGHPIKGSATGLLAGITGLAANTAGTGSVAGQSASTGITLQAAATHTHGATFAGQAMATHTHPIALTLNGGAQTPIDIRPASVTVRWIMRVK